MTEVSDENTVRLTFNNYEFEVTVDAETYDRLNNDDVYKEDFARQTYESLENDGHFVVEEKEVKPNTASLFKWSKPAVDKLINIRFSLNKEFSTAKTRKSELWQSVAQAMEPMCPGITGEMCDAKYRNLLHTYKTNKQKQIKFGPDAVKWEYFEQFDAVLDMQVNVHNNNDSMYFDSIFSEDIDHTYSKEDLLILGASPLGSPSSHAPKLKTLRELTVPQYLRIKAEHDLKSLKLKARIWKEKKQLKEEEIKAIMSLAKALKNNKK